MVEVKEHSGLSDEEDEDNAEDALREDIPQHVGESEFDEEDDSSGSASGHRSASSIPEKPGYSRDEIQKVWEF